MVGGRSERGSRRHAAAASVVVPFPRDAAGVRLDLVRFVPSGRSLLATFGVLVAIGFAYWLAYSTPVFAVDKVEVRGAPPGLAHEVSLATRGLVGQSLVAIDAGEVEGTLRALPEVAGVSVDRAFPNTLVVKVAPERPVAVVRSGTSAWPRARSPTKSFSASTARSMMPIAAALGRAPLKPAKLPSMLSHTSVAPFRPTMRSAPLTWCRCSGQGCSSASFSGAAENLAMDSWTSVSARSTSALIQERSVWSAMRLFYLCLSRFPRQPA